jgi:hypothetical protein
MTPNCICDKFVFPSLSISAGLSALPRQIATFPEFREFLLSKINTESALQQWRARGSDDFGVMLLEMWSYVCDAISFYDEVIADESYIRTAALRPSVRKLVGLLGYIPRPAIGARVDLAILANGRLPVLLPAGTQFRSGAFPGGAPQTFELTADARIHPFLNGWSLQRRRYTRINVAGLSTTQQSTLLLDARSTRLKQGQVVLVEDLAHEVSTRARLVQSVEDVTGKDGEKYKSVTFDAPVPILGATPVTAVRLLTPSQTASIWQGQVASGATSGLLPTNPSLVVFDSLHRDIQPGDRVVLDKSGEKRWFNVIWTHDVLINLSTPGPVTVSSGGSTTSTISMPAPRITVTAIELDTSVNDLSRKEIGKPPWTSSDASSIKVYFGFRVTATPTAEFLPLLRPYDSLVLTPPIEIPQDGIAPGSFLFEDRDTIGAKVSASLDFTTGVLSASPALAGPLAAPVQAYGNVVSASRGETVSAEILGSGDASTASQTFKLRKSPLTYFPGTDAPESTLRVFVDGLLWMESASFFGAAPDAQSYIVRQDDNGDSFVTFGDGIRGSRLSSGTNNVVAYYRFGAGKASPPAGSIKQLGKPVKGVSSVRNPVAAYGGDDPEPASNLRGNAPRSALLLGRAISLVDMEAAASSVDGVRAVRCEWQWNVKRQRPLVEVWYVGDAQIAVDVTRKLRGLSDSVTPIEVEQAISLPSILSLSIEIDARRLEDDVLSAVRTNLMDPDAGLLPPERVGIGSALFQSKIFDAVLTTPGAVAVQGLLLNGAIFGDYGVDPGAGKYFDFEAGSLVLNGKAA